jgi:hypothetical protein
LAVRSSAYPAELPQLGISVLNLRPDLHILSFLATLKQTQQEFWNQNSSEPPAEGCL